MAPKHSATLWQMTYRAAAKGLGLSGFFAAILLSAADDAGTPKVHRGRIGTGTALFAQAAGMNQRENDLLSFSSAILAAGVNQDTLQISLLQRLTDTVAIVIRDGTPIQPSVRAQTLNNLVATIELLFPVTDRRYDTVLVALANALDIALYPHFWDLPAGQYDGLLARLRQAVTTNAFYPPGSGAANALTTLIADVVSRAPRVAAPKPPSDVPSLAGAFNPGQPVFLGRADLANARQRLAAGDAWAVRRQQALTQEAAAAPALDAIPDAMLYKPDASDQWAQQGIALATLWRLDGVATNRVDRAKKILLSFANGFHANEPGLTQNDGLDFSVSVPSFAYLFELLYPALTPGEGAAIATKFSLIAERLQQTAYGADPSLDATVRNARLLSNHRTWQDAAAYVAALASGRQDVAAWALGSADPTVRDGGLRFHLRESYGPNDLILEGPSFGYQLYDGMALALAARAAQTSGSSADLSGYLDGRLRRLLGAVIRYARADLTTPVDGDSGWIDLRQQTSLYALVNAIYGGDPASEWVMNQERPVAFRAQTVVADALAIWTAPDEGAVPAPAPADAHQQGILEFRQYSDLLNPGVSTTFFTPQHTTAHGIANHLAIETAVNGVTLSAQYHPGSSAYANDAMNAQYWRDRAGNIMELNGTVPLGFASFDENGARSTLTVAIEQPGAGVTAHVGFGEMNGGYVKNGTDHADRAFIQVDGTSDHPSYRLVDSRLQARAARRPQRAGAIWHGPRGASGTQTALAFTPAPRTPADDPTFRYVDRGSAALQKTGPLAGAWSVRWTASDRQTSLQLNALPAPDAAHVTLGVGPETAPFLYVENMFPAGAPVNFESTIVLQDLPAGMQAAQVSPLQSHAAASGAIVQSATVRDWSAVSHDAAAAEMDNPADASERLVVAGHYGVARIRDGRIDLVGDVSAIALRVPSTGPVTVTLNGVDIPARFLRRIGTLVIWGRGPSNQ